MNTFSNRGKSSRCFSRRGSSKPRLQMENRRGSHPSKDLQAILLGRKRTPPSQSFLDHPTAIFKFQGIKNIYMFFFSCFPSFFSSTQEIDRRVCNLKNRHAKELNHFPSCGVAFEGTLLVAPVSKLVNNHRWTGINTENFDGESAWKGGCESHVRRVSCLFCRVVAPQILR